MCQINVYIVHVYQSRLPSSPPKKPPDLRIWHILLETGDANFKRPRKNTTSQEDVTERLALSLYGKHLTFVFLLIGVLPKDILWFFPPWDLILEIMYHKCSHPGDFFYTRVTTVDCSKLYVSPLLFYKRMYAFFSPTGHFLENCRNSN